jgi:hypothetical protein
MAVVNLRAPTEVTARFVAPIITTTSSLVLENPVNSGQMYRITKLNLRGLTGLEPGYFAGYNGFPGGVTVSFVQNGAVLGQLGTFIKYGQSHEVTIAGSTFNPTGFFTFYLEEGVSLVVEFGPNANPIASLAAQVTYEVIGAPTV